MLYDYMYGFVARVRRLWHLCRECTAIVAVKTQNLGPRPNKLGFSKYLL